MQLPDEEGEGLGAGEQLTHLGRSLDDLDEFGGRVSALGVFECETAEGVEDWLVGECWLLPAGSLGQWAALTFRKCCILAASLHTPWPITLVQGWGSDDEGDARLDEELTREYHFGGGLFEKKAGGGQEGEEGGEEGEERPHKKSKKEVRRRAVWAGTCWYRWGRGWRAVWVALGRASRTLLHSKCRLLCAQWDSPWMRRQRTALQAKAVMIRTSVSTVLYGISSGDGGDHRQEQGVQGGEAAAAGGGPGRDRGPGRPVQVSEGGGPTCKAGNCADCKLES